MAQSPPAPRRRGRPPTGKAAPAAERMRQLRARRKAMGLKAVSRWEQPDRTPLTYSPHQLHDARSLAMHAVIAARISRNPSLIQKAHDNLQRWSNRQGESIAPWILEWQALLHRPWAEVAGIIAGLTEESARLRQSSPFAGILNAAERRRIREAFRP